MGHFSKAPKDLNRRKKAIGVWEEVVRRFDKANEPVLRELVAQALVNKGLTLRALNRSEDEIEVYEEVERRFSKANEPALREIVAWALRRRRRNLNRLRTRSTLRRGSTPLGERQ